MLASNMEKRVHGILTVNGVPFKEEYTFPNLTTKKGVPLRFDFAVFDDDGGLWFLIETQGIQHYKPIRRFGGQNGLSKQKYNDARKRAYCRKNGITLVEIPYTDEERISYEYIIGKAEGGVYA